MLIMLNLNCKNSSYTRKGIVFHGKSPSQGPNPEILDHGSQIPKRTIVHQKATGKQHVKNLSSLGNTGREIGNRQTEDITI
jgi:hypothetical protein